MKWNRIYKGFNVKAAGNIEAWIILTSLNTGLLDFFTDSRKVFVQFVSDDGSDRVLQRTRSMTDVAIWHTRSFPSILKHVNVTKKTFLYLTIGTYSKMFMFFQRSFFF